MLRIAAIIVKKPREKTKMRMMRRLLLSCVFLIIIIGITIRAKSDDIFREA